MNKMSQFNVAVVGGGLVGALESCLLARKGFNVTLFESRHDGRNEPTYYGRSINLAISHRGISALRRLDFEHIVQEQAIPMRARLIHDKNGECKPIPYDPDGRCINSIERAGLNNFVLDRAEQQFNVKILFNHKLVDMDANEGSLFFRVGDNRESESETEPLIKYKFNLILGCDGARSNVRSLLARQTQLEFSQTFIEHGYLELRIDANENGSFKMPTNYLHIWPRGKYMMIALPNKDGSFTCTLFMPFEMFHQLKNPDQALGFFELNFPDTISLIGAERIKDTLLNVRASPLISIKCKPYHYKGRVALLGDSAHAMVPFYGQGMNCGFEDCLVLDELFDKYAADSNSIDSTTVNSILNEYSAIRCANGQSMGDLAMYNYIEMRDLVNTWSFLLRKYLDNLLYRLFPTKWIPLYTMVTFTRIPVEECVRRRETQDKILARCGKLGCIALVVLAVGTTLSFVLYSR